MPEGRDKSLLAGLGLSDSLGQSDLNDPAVVATTLAGTPVLVTGKRDLKTDLTVLRQSLEAEAARIAEDAERAQTPGRPGVRPLRGSDE
jgi:hypothetical protein